MEFGKTDVVDALMVVDLAAERQTDLVSRGDPGTGIEVLNALLRVFLTLRAPADGQEDPKKHQRVHVGRPTIEDMLTDAFGPILREGGKEIEVSLRLMKTLAAMHANLPAMRAPIACWARRHAARIDATLEDRDDLVIFQQAYARAWPASA